MFLFNLLFDLSKFDWCSCFQMIFLSCLFDLSTFDWYFHSWMAFIAMCPIIHRDVLLKDNMLTCLSWNLSLKYDICAFISFRFRGIFFINVLCFRIWSVNVEFIIMCSLEGTNVYFCIYHCMSSWRNW